MKARPLQHFIGFAFAMIFFLLATSNAYAQCSCSPAQKDGWPDEMTYTVSFEAGISTADQNTIRDAVNQWNAFFTGMNLPAPFTFVASGGDVTVFADQGLVGTQVGMLNKHEPGNGKGRIGLNPDFANGENGFIKHSALHEFGHSLGFDHVTGFACKGQTVMFSTISPAGPWLGSLTACDKSGARTAFAPTTGAPKAGETQTPTSGGDAITVYGDPMVLDLNGDGVHTSDVFTPVRFDINGDGTKELITWTNPLTEEGFLWIDRNHNGRVDDGTELFGIGTDLPSGIKARDGFEALAMYDMPLYGGNSDGRVSADDAVWERLRVWIDRNHDGVCDPGEYGPLHRYHIEALNLESTWPAVDDESANALRIHGSYSRSIIGNGRPHVENWAMDSLLFRILER
ncbi:MAG: hypothetical protein JWO97_4603 [Acidobacteria bacterium]|nr:hypothetical protein [Acidobacteriota bacterium]